MALFEKPQQQHKDSANSQNYSTSNTDAHNNIGANPRRASASISASPSVSDVSKTKRTKSRNGCVTCKKKRLKCDETKPFCLNCQKKNIDCGGYATSFKWRSFNDDSSNKGASPSFSINLTNNDVNDNKKKKRSYSEVSHNSSQNSVNLINGNQYSKQDEVLKKHLELASLSVVGKSSQDIKFENDLISKGLNPVSANNSNHYNDNESRRMKRSFSLSINVGMSPSQKPFKSQNSTSMSNSHSFDVTLLRQEYSRIKNNNSGTALDSLADAAIDEIKTRSPSAPSPDIFNQFNRQSTGTTPGAYNMSPSAILTERGFPLKEESSDNHEQEKKCNKDLELILNNQATPGNMLEHEKIQPFNITDGVPFHDLNLTPNLTALISYAFNGNSNDEFPKGSNINTDLKLNELIDIPLSPLALTNAGSSSHPPFHEGNNFDNEHNFNQDSNQNGSQSLHHKRSPLLPRGRVQSPAISTQDTTSVSSPPMSHQHGQNNHKVTFLEDINSPMTSINSVTSYSPTIELNQSNSSLMKTSEQEQILHLYTTYTSSIMSIKNGPNENPWRNRIAPFATNFPCLFNSIAAMTLFHLAGNTDVTENSINLRSKGCMYMKKCILELATGLSKMNDTKQIDNGSAQLPADIALATCLNLAVSESWNTHTSSGIAHLKGAKSMIQKVLTLFREHAKEITDKKREITESPGDHSKDNFSALIKIDRRDLKKKLVLVDDADWEKMAQDVLLSDYEKKTNNSVINKFQTKKSSGGGNSHSNNELYVPRDLQFLFNIWIYFEVLAQMTTYSNQDDKGIDLVATITTILQDTQNKRVKEKNDKAVREGPNDGSSINTSPSMQSDSSDLTFGGGNNGNAGFSFFDNFEAINFNNEYVDPLLGCAQSLFLIMGKVANLICKINKLRRKDEKQRHQDSNNNNSNNTGGNKGRKQSHRNSLSIITLATGLKQRLMDWKPIISSTMIDQSAYESCSKTGWDMPSCIATAESYRYATLIYLHQAVPEIPSLSSHQLAEKIFILLASIPTNSDLSVVHIFPLLVASCEAELGEEREWCESRWTVLSEKMWLGNIDRALEVVKEVWRRKDDYMRKKRRDEDDVKFNLIRNSGENRGNGDARTKGKEDKVNGSPTSDISIQISGLMAAINNEPSSSVLDDSKCGISSKLHWSSVMREWDWEVMLG